MSNDYSKTARILTSMTMGASGWDLGLHDAVNNSGPLIFLYVFDKPTGWTWACSVPRATFNDFASKATALIKHDPDHVEPIRGGVAYFISEASVGKVPVMQGVGATLNTDGILAEWQEQFGALLTAYAATTRTFSLADGMRAGGHFVVVNYRQPGDKDGMLRPFAMGGTKNQILPVEVFQGAIKQVLEIDMKKHPEWFQPSKPRPAGPR